MWHKAWIWNRAVVRAVAGVSVAFGLATMSAGVADAAPVCGDHDGNGLVTAGDALSVLRRSVGLPADLNCGSECPDPERVDLSVAGARDDCGATHAAVGRTATLSTRAHQVSGTVTVVDDCTLALDGFNYDGGGIRVHIYGGTGGDYTAGPDLSINLLGTEFTDAKALVRLPEGVTLDDFDGVSVWCVTATSSFGDGLFQ